MARWKRSKGCGQIRTDLGEKEKETNKRNSARKQVMKEGREGEFTRNKAV